MWTIRLARSALTYVGLPGVALGLMAGLADCSSDDSTAIISGSDASADQGGDTSVDVAPDVPVSGDGGVEAAPDGVASEGAVDAPADAATDAPTGEGGGGEASCPLAVPELDGFVNAMVTTMCQRLENCCQLSAAQFDMANCLSTYSNPKYGGWLGVAFTEPFYDAGTIGYDKAAACQCLQGNANLSCGAVAAQARQMVVNSCFAAVHGTLPVGDGGCASTYECAAGEFCANGDGGTCQSLLGDGGACTTDQMCSYLGNGTPPSYCDPTSHTCTPRLSNGTACKSNAACQSNICLYTAMSQQCVSSLVFSDPGVAGGTCDYFTIKDAGGGG